MSTLRATNIKHESSATNQIVLGADGSIGGTLGDTLAAKGDIAGETWTGTHDFSGATVVGAGGLVLVASSSFSAVSAASLDSAFSAGYDNYRVIIEVTAGSANAELYWRLRASGTDLTSSTYYGSRIQSDFGTNSVNGYSISGTNLQLAYTVAGSTSSIAVDLISPYAARNTKISGHGINANTGGNQRSVGGVVADSNQYDGMTVYPASGTITGTVRVYGYANS